MFSEMDFLPTFAKIIGSSLPADRPIDGVDLAASVGILINYKMELRFINCCSYLLERILWAGLKILNE